MSDQLQKWSDKVFSCFVDSINIIVNTINIFLVLLTNTIDTNVCSLGTVNQLSST